MKKLNIKSALAAMALAITPMVAVVLPQTAKAEQADRRVTIINNSNNIIWTIKATSSDNSSWGDVDLLGDNVLKPGQRITLWVSDGSGDCIMDLRAHTRSGQTVWTKTAYNVCVQDRWILNP
jgi:hypothetical protein